MIALRELISISDWMPPEGEQRELYFLVQNDFTREEAAKKFKNVSRFRQTYKKLKDRYLQEVLVMSFKNAGEYNQQEVKLYKKYTQTKLLIRAAKKKAAMSAATEVLTSAKMLGVVEVAHSMSSELMTHYSTVEPNQRKYKLYEKQTLSFAAALLDESRAKAVYNRLKMKMNLDLIPKSIKKDLEILNELAESNNHYRFRFYYYLANYLYRRYKNDTIGIVNVCEDAVKFFGDCPTRMPAIVKVSFYFYMTPLLIRQGRYERAKDEISVCLALVGVGSFNYHMVLLMQAINSLCLGKLSGAKYALNEAGKQWHFKSEAVVSYWMDVQKTIQAVENGAGSEMAGLELLKRLYDA